MKELLTEIFQKAVLFKENNQFTPEQRQNKWIGNDPAEDEEIAYAEKRLGISLPTDYKELLKVSNGFSTWSDAIDPSFMKIEEIGYLKEIDPELVEIWSDLGNEDITKELERSILVGGLNEEQYFLLIPPIISSEGWQYWKFASWIPGEQIYQNLTHYLKDMLNFMNEC